MDKLITYESFFSKLFKRKKKKQVFIDKGTDGPYAFGNYEVNPELRSYLDDVLSELLDEGFELRYEKGFNSKKHHGYTTFDILILHLPNGYGGEKLDFHSSKLEDMIHHLNSYLSKDWNMSLEEILVVYSYETDKLHEYLHSVEEYDMVDDILQEIAIKFKVS